MSQITFLVYFITEQYHAQPLEDNLYEWHFTIRGAPDTDFADGIYHGRIMLPPDYPMKPPSIVLLTPNGRFEINKKICLSISGHHPESWQPSWSIRTALMAIIGFLPSPGKGAIGALDYPPEERKKLAKRSKDWKCPVCDVENHQLLRTSEAASGATDEILQEVRDLARKISFKGESGTVSESGDGAKVRINSESDDAPAASIVADLGSTAASAESSSKLPPISESQPTEGEAEAAGTDPSTDEIPPKQLSSDASTTPPPGPLTPAFPLDGAQSSSTTSNASAALPASSEMENTLRQRVGRLEDVAEREVSAREAVAAASRETTPARPAPAARYQAYSTTSSYLMILLSIAIGVLLLRRILRLVDFQFDFQFDYNVERH